MDDDDNRSFDKKPSISSRLKAFKKDLVCGGITGVI